MARRSCSPRTIREVLDSLHVAFEVTNGDVVVTGITQDSREVVSGDVYCCIRGEHFDGHAYAHVAVTSGAVAIIADRDISGLPSGVAMIRVSDVREFIGLFASSLFGRPSSQLTMAGVTGTNGKTTTTALIASILEASGKTVQQIGTLTGARTTPEAIDLHAQLRDCVDAGVDCVVMEVSSHALAHGRVKGTKFDVAVFTNLGRDHLDFHGTEEEYFAAKAKLFSPELSRHGVVNVDDPHGSLLRDAATIPMTAFSESDVHAAVIRVDSVSYEWNGNTVSVPMGGSFTLMNSLAAATATKVLGIANEAIVEGLRRVKQVPGRFESVPNAVGIGVIVDYAHTPESLELLLASVRQVCRGRMTVVFGCGGNRDAGKRPLMGRIAESMADVVIVTSDNPRDEDPQVIVNDICAGFTTSSAHVSQVLERELAIESAISGAQRDDIVVIVGKGHETYQEVSGVMHPFSDVDVAQKALRRREETTE